MARRTNAVFLAAALAISVTNAAAGEVSCTSVTKALDKGMHVALAGATMLSVVEETKGIAVKAKPFALAVGLVVAIYTLAKDYFFDTPTAVVCSSPNEQGRLLLTKKPPPLHNPSELARRRFSEPATMDNSLGAPRSLRHSSRDRGTLPYANVD
jgi:hypothetical protein